MGNTCKHFGIYLGKKIGKIGLRYRFFYGIYSAMAMGYIWQNYGIYWYIGYILQKLRDVLGKIMGYTLQKLCDILV